MNTIENIHGVHFLCVMPRQSQQHQYYQHAGALRNNGVHGNESAVNII